MTRKPVGKSLGMGNTYLMSFDKKRTVEEAIFDYSRSRYVEYAERDYYTELCITTPNDEYYDYQWHHHTFGPYLQWYPIDSDSAWDIETGAPRIVAVLDTGIVDHEDLNGKVVHPWDFIEGDGHPQDIDNHGTPVSGIIGANTNNSHGVAGICWPAKIMPVKIHSDGVGTTGTLAQGMTYAVNHGAWVLNCSVASYWGTETLQNAVEYAYSSNGRLVVASAGNNYGNHIMYPAAYSEVIAVGATTKSGFRAYFSNWGRELELTAPGVEIHTTSAQSNESYMPFGGTSAVAPVVSGVAILAWSKFGGLNNVQLRKWLQSCVRPGNGQTLIRDWYFGYGIINACYAVTSGKGGENASGKPISESEDSVLVNNVKISLADTKVYPNPASNVTYVRFQNDGRNYEVGIFDISGRKICDWTGNDEGQVSVEWDLTQGDGSRVSEGIYLIKVENADDNVVKKVVVSH